MSQLAEQDLALAPAGVALPTQRLPRPHHQPWTLQRSQELLARAELSVAGMTLSMMKRPEHFAPGQFPVYLQSGAGALVTDVDGNEYIDLICGLGANSLGHGHPSLTAAVGEALASGALHSLPVALEVEAAEALCSLIPGGEMARFFKTGADATSAAVRLARFVTGREQIITVGYNGWHDHFMYDTPGVPVRVSELSERLPLFTLENEQLVLQKVAAAGESLAAIILSVPYNRVVTGEFLHALRELCTKQGTILVFDEIVTGFRIATAGVQEFFGVRPDLSCFSKAMAGGFPLSAVVGARSLLQRMAELQVSTTFGGEQGALAACLAVLQLYREQSVPEQLARLGRRLRAGINAVAEQLGASLRVVGYDAIPFFLFDPAPPQHVEKMRVFQGLMAERGVLLRRDVNFLHVAHSDEHIDFVISAAAQSLRAMQGGRV